MVKHSSQRNSKKIIGNLISWVVCIMIFASTVTWIQAEQVQPEKAEEFTVTGVVKFPKSGDIWLRLMTKEQRIKSREEDNEEEENKGGEGIDFAADKDVTGLLTIKLSEKEVEQKQVSFAFTDIPRGTYMIEGYQDINGDGLFNVCFFGSSEPFGNYRRKRTKFRDPKFEESAFEVNQDIDDIVIEMWE